ncbi:MAG: RluA family pseudouridine synthase [Lachnospiraceae bacterium]|nr:RluA family pseudouridine synthase [Lachnospiraceae bacterium]
MDKYRIIYEDEQFFVIWKASGTPVQSAKVTLPDVMSMLGNELSERGIRAPYLGLIHRLDQPVEGLFLVARTKQAATELGRQVREHVHMEKWYQTLVCGKPPRKEGVLVDYLRKEDRANMSKVVPAGTKGAKKCELSYEVLREENGTCLLKIRLLTGRHHQIRVQLAHAGCPIVGDRKYGKAEGGPFCLCACELRFLHPVTREKMRFCAEPSFLKKEK